MKDDISPLELSTDQYTFTAQLYRHNLFERKDQWFPWWHVEEEFFDHEEGPRYSMRLNENQKKNKRNRIAEIYIELSQY